MLDREVVGVDKKCKEDAAKFPVFKIMEIIPLEFTPYEMIRLQLKGDRNIQVAKLRGQLVFFQYEDDGKTIDLVSVSPIEVSDYIREKVYSKIFAKKPTS